MSEEATVNCHARGQKAMYSPPRIREVPITRTDILWGSNDTADNETESDFMEDFVFGNS